MRKILVTTVLTLVVLLGLSTMMDETHFAYEEHPDHDSIEFES
ncbi:hypothetical protein [Sediminibacillus dalangtanensis]|nr:hypothetical protein [Sediminibacillus dalangtanensis]